ncbi:MAG: RNA methyltransferase [Bdellovibrionaceae bacterium]|nr:RNA methyltransferase [Pseudobdellovibrionaceae bacterium]
MRWFKAPAQLMVRDYSLTVVLVRPLYSRNVGAVARAMVNMGFEDLVLIDPHCEIDYECHQAAATGQKPLEQVKIFSSWKDFNHSYPRGVRWAFTPKDGQSRIVHSLLDVLPHWQNDASKHWEDVGKSYSNHFIFVFGPEDHGLYNEDISFCHQCVALPTFGDNPSLNLAQAVLLALYSVRLKWGGTPTPLKQRTYYNELIPATGDEWFCDESFQKFLRALGLSWEGRRVSVYTALRQYFLRCVPTHRELRMLHMIFEQAARKLQGGTKNGNS